MAGAYLHAVSYCDWFLSLMNSSGLLAGLDFGPILAGRHFCCRCWCFLLALDRRSGGAEKVHGFILGSVEVVVGDLLHSDAISVISVECYGAATVWSLTFTLVRLLLWLCVVELDWVLASPRC
ncbi:hypothetical protein Nepgr_014713 [Nepenthes gracilis]|uniref:Uncharacterized protein n=1 Tax=Nepenthes gracilis TaxID=150966 RepID=A0AAD3SLT5_NEPGR|nr:hypothetical protein Nepgr_014713 [Nepenthes gracilis]